VDHRPVMFHGRNVQVDRLESLFLVYPVWKGFQKESFRLIHPRCLLISVCSVYDRMGLTLSGVRHDISPIHQSICSGSSSESWRWALRRSDGSSGLLSSDDLIVWYHYSSAFTLFRRSWITSSIRSPNLQIGKTVISPHPVHENEDSRKFQGTNPLVSPLNLQCSLLPIRLVSDISRQDHLALSGDIIHNYIEYRLEVPSICFTECKHSTSKCL
jgi:hypothetical protein